MIKKKEQLRTLEQRLSFWNKKLDRLKHHAGVMKEGAKSEYYKNLQVIFKKRNELRDRIHEKKTAGRAAWGEIKSGTGAAWTEVRHSFTRAKKKLKPEA